MPYNYTSLYVAVKATAKINYKIKDIKPLSSFPSTSFDSPNAVQEVAARKKST